MKASIKFTILIMTTALYLCGCGAETKETEESLKSTVVVETTETTLQETSEQAQETSELKQETSGQEQESAVVESESSFVQPDFDVEMMLEEAEKDAAALEKKLLEDASLKQMDMNMLAAEMYQVWDDLLNELWGILKETLDEDVMEDLLKEQRAWITDKEAEVKQAGAAVSGGSMAPLVSNQRAAEITKERVYELAAYLGFDKTKEE